MDTGDDRQDKNKQEPFYSSEDCELLVSILKEYSIKLELICTRINNQNKTETVFEVMAVFTIFVLIWLLVNLPKIYHYILSLLFSNIVGIISFFGALFSVLALTHYLMKFLNLKMKYLETRGMVISQKLEKTVRVASQIEEHFEKNFARRIELDFALSDAEAALKEYYNICSPSLDILRFIKKFLRR